MATVTRIRRVSPLQLGKMLALVQGILSLVFIPFMLIPMGIGIVASAAAGNAKNAAFPAAFGVGFGIVMLIALPIVYAIFGFIFGALGALIYNMVAKWVGGIEIELE